MTTSHEKVISHSLTCLWYFNYVSVSWKQWNVSAIHVNVKESYIRSKMSCCVFGKPTVLSKNNESIEQVFTMLSFTTNARLSLSGNPPIFVFLLCAIQVLLLCGK